MLGVIVEKEIRDIVGSAKFAFTFGVVAILIIASFYIGASHYQSDRAQYEASVSENLRQLEGLTDWFNIEDFRIFLPPHPLGALVTGISNDIGRTTSIYGSGDIVAHDSKFNDEPVYAVFRFLDLEFIFAIVLSLFAILLGYNAVSGEKEAGTLRLALANAVPRHIYIIGKLIGSFACLSVSVLLAILMGCLLLPIMGVPFSGDDWLRLSLIILTGMMYFGAFLTLSIFISSLTHRSSNSFLLLLVIWVVLVLVIPRASVLLAGRAVDVPSVDNIAYQKASLSSQLWAESREKMSKFRPSASPEEDPMAMMDEFNKFMGDIGKDRQKRMDEFSGRLSEDRRNRQSVQSRWAFNLARLSPTASLSLATSELAGTSLALKENYHREAVAYQQKYGEFLEEKTGMAPGGAHIIIRKIGEEEEELEAIDPTELPSFDYHRITTPKAVQAAVPDMGLLAIFNLIFFIGAIFAFVRYDPR